MSLFTIIMARMFPSTINYNLAQTIRGRHLWIKIDVSFTRKDSKDHHSTPLNKILTFHSLETMQEIWIISSLIGKALMDLSY